MEEKAAKFDLFRIEEFDTHSIARYLFARATGQLGALEQFPPEEDDAFLDGLVTYYELASDRQRKLLLEGLVWVLEWVSSKGAQEIPDSATLQLFNILPLYIGIGANEIQSRAAKVASEFLGPDRQQVARLAALVLAELKSGYAIQLLDSFSVRNPREDWILPILLSARSKFSVFDALDIEYGRIRPQIADPTLRFVVQDCLRSMIDEDVQLAKAAILRCVADWPEQGRSFVAKMLKELADQLKLGTVSSICDEIVEPLSKGFRARQHAFLGTLLDDLDAAIFVKKEPADIATAQAELRRFIEDLSSEDLTGQWPMICGYAQRCGARPDGSAGLKVLTEIVLSSKIGLSYLDRAQRGFFEGTSARSKESGLRRDRIVQRARSHVKQIGTVNHPPVLRIARTQFAEDVYVELLSIVLEAAFPDMKVELVSGVAWDQVDTELLGDNIDVALNNDDILSYDKWDESHVIARVSGSPLYKLDQFTMIGDADFLLHRGVQPELVAKAIRDKSTPIFAAVDSEDQSLRAVLEDSSIVTSHANVLERLIDQMLEGMDIETVPVTKRLPHIALNYFLDETVPLLLGGIIHTEYALQRCSRAVPLITLRQDVEGRLFARTQLVKDYPEFSKMLLLALDEVRNLWYKPGMFNFHSGFEDYLVRHVNLTMNETVATDALSESPYDEDAEVSLASVLNIQELKSILNRSRLLPSKGRKWQDFRKSSPESIAQLDDYRNAKKTGN
jgi:hypothetical protein